VCGVLLGLLIARRAMSLASHNRLIFPAVAFFFSLNLIDEWADSPWIGLGLLTIAGVVREISVTQRGGVP
jgi:hypothetical protein